MSSFSTAAEVSLRTETREEGRKNESRECSDRHRLTAGAGQADLEKAAER